MHEIFIVNKIYLFTYLGQNVAIVENISHPYYTGQLKNYLINMMRQRKGPTRLCEGEDFMLNFDFIYVFNPG
jgi:hypothetical protein